MYLISDAAKQVSVEAHVLRYWEEELELPIKRNELGHRFYTEQDVDRFREIKIMKERGLQLKAIRLILKDGKLDRLTTEPIVAEMPKRETYLEETGEDKAKRLQWLLQQLFRETLQENNKELIHMMKESILKELDYQFRVQDEKEEERHTEFVTKQEEHFRKIDELLRKKRRLLKK